MTCCVANSEFAAGMLLMHERKEMLHILGNVWPYIRLTNQIRKNKHILGTKKKTTPEKTTIIILKGVV